MKYTLVALLLISLQATLSGQDLPFVTHPQHLKDPRYAEWIVPFHSAAIPDEGVYCFRKSLTLDTLPPRYLIHLSADARYRFYVNGEWVCWGPAVGDLDNWIYETVDLAPYFRKGENILAAQVWNHGELAGTRQISHRTAFILQGDSPAEVAANTDPTWMVARDSGLHALPMNSQIAGGGYIAGATDSVVVSRQPRGWKVSGYDDQGWERATPVGKGNHTGLDTWTGTPWGLQPRTIPAMFQEPREFKKVLEIKGKDTGELPPSLDGLVVPPGKRITVLLDNGELTMGYPRLRLSGGEGGKVRMRYQESLFGPTGKKGHRDQWRGKEMKGIYDIWVPDGGPLVCEPLWIRVFRYMELTLEAGHEPLILHELDYLYTAYPFEPIAEFRSGDPGLDAIWETSWRTASLCALESYMDCPYYEQLQYIGDTRIQSLISLYTSGDDRLARNALRNFRNSIQPMGQTKSSHPSSVVQIIPPYSLLYVAMVHDYYRIRNDPDFIREFIPGIRFILEWFISRIGKNGIMGPIPYWNHVDGGTGFSDGSPPGISNGGSAHMTLLLAYTLERAWELMDQFGYIWDAERYRVFSDSLRKQTFRLCFDHERFLMAETPEKKVFSQHTNSFAVLTDAVPRSSQAKIMDLCLTDPDLIQATLYFKFYLFQAMKKAGLGDRVLGEMTEWTRFLDNGLTTFPEHGLESRSDCHAWAAHPIFDFLNITCGIEPGEPGFGSVRITPATGELEEVFGSVAHPGGLISTRYKKTPAGYLECEIHLPDGLEGTLIHGDTAYFLTSGINRRSLPPIEKPEEE